ncbi:MAG: hypothetical protein LUD47_07450 [Clostridia bacterium]|nr:hypothetical protein [Clostridia bacterium]
MVWKITLARTTTQYIYDTYQSANDHFWREVHRAEAKFGDGKVFYFENGTRWQQGGCSANFIELKGV